MAPSFARLDSRGRLSLRGSWGPHFVGSPTSYPFYSRHWYTYKTSARAPSRLAALDAAMKPTFTLGIEEEYQTVDPETRDLRSHIHAEIIEKGKLILQERVKTEMHQSVVEVGTSVCANIKEAEKN